MKAAPSGRQLRRPCKSENLLVCRKDLSCKTLLELRDAKPDKDTNDDQSRTPKPDRSGNQRDTGRSCRAESPASGCLRPLPEDQELPLAYVGQPFSRLSPHA